MTPAPGFGLGNFTTSPTSHHRHHQQSSPRPSPSAHPFLGFHHADKRANASSHSPIPHSTGNCGLHDCQEEWALLGLCGSTHPALSRGKATPSLITGSFHSLLLCAFHPELPMATLLCWVFQMPSLTNCFISVVRFSPNPTYLVLMSVLLLMSDQVRMRMKSV